MPDWLLIFLGFGVLTILIIALVCLSVIIEQWCASHRIKEEPRADGDWNRRQENIQSTDVRVIAFYLKTIADEAYATRQQYNRHEERRATLEKVGVIAAIIAAALAGLSAWIFYGQLDEMWADQRPWIGLMGIQTFDESMTTGFGYGVEIVNTGKSPAFEVSFSVQDWRQDPNNPHIPSEKCVTDCAMKNLVMPPGGIEGMRVPLLGKPRPKVGDVAWIIVRVDYRDLKHEWHKTKICFTATARLVSDDQNRQRLAVDQVACPIPDSNYAD